MCGIGGIVRMWKAGEKPPGIAESIPEEWLNILDVSVKHRGPDGQGRFRQRVVRADGVTVDVALVHRRLSIIDHAGGGQPMLLGGGVTTEAQRGEGGFAAETQRAQRGTGNGEGGTGQLLWMEGPSASPPGGLAEYRQARAHVCPTCGPCAVVFNGCIYNHRELRRELQALGHVFRSDHSDTEVLLHGWGEWKERLPEKLDGMYALLIWDRANATVSGFRDQSGEKPAYSLVLHPRESPAGVAVFSSASAALITLAARVKGAEPLPMEDFVLEDWIEYGWSIRNAGPVSSVNEFSCGDRRTASYEPGVRIATEPQCRVPERDSGASLTPGDVDSLVRRSVESRLDADVPLACFLSGGIDSALVAAHAHRLRPDTRAFTVHMPFAAFDESGAAGVTARHLGMTHEVLDCEMTPAADLVDLITQLGMPFGDSSLLPTYWVSRAARQKVRVALSGDGGDELFGGYERHAINSTLTRWRLWLRLFPGLLLPARDPKSRSAKLQRLVHAARGSGYDDLLRIFPTKYRPSLFRRAAGGHRRFRREPDPLLHDYSVYLPADILRKTDTASMAVALEVRSPFLSRDLVKACLSAPLENLMPRGQRKGLLRQVARKYFPAEIVDRPKQGFAIPIGEWFRTDFGGMRQLLRDHLEGPDPFPGLPVEINMTFVRRMLREHDEAGEKSLNPWHGRDHSQRLYMLLVLSIWAKWLARL